MKTAKKKRGHQTVLVILEFACYSLQIETKLTLDLKLCKASCLHLYYYHDSWIKLEFVCFNCSRILILLNIFLILTKIDRLIRWFFTLQIGPNMDKNYANWFKSLILLPIMALMFCNILFFALSNYCENQKMSSKIKIQTKVKINGL